jgi:hypothetical protein
MLQATSRDERDLCDGFGVDDVNGPRVAVSPHARLGVAKLVPWLVTTACTHQLDTPPSEHALAQKGLEARHVLFLA